MGTKERIIRTVIALLLSLLLHLLILVLLFVSFEDVVLPPQHKTQSMRLSLNDFSSPKSEPTAHISKNIPTSNAIVKKKLLDQKKKEYVKKQTLDENNATKTTPKAQKHLVKKEEKPKRKIIKKKRVQKRKSKDSLASALMGFGGTSKSKAKKTINTMIHNLYGREFGSFTNAQKNFIKHNLEDIQRITQRTLTNNGYPEVAIQTRQEGTAIVTFNLHPNGNITSLRLKRRIGYTSLDSNTLEVIRIAYKDYPYPKTTTKITFYVRYSFL
jgi:TonB family protein